MKFSILVSVFHILTIYLIAGSNAQDCKYNKCAYKINPSLHHVPCIGTGNRKLVRNVDCVDGTTYHICCIYPLRTEVQKSRQRWFRAVTAAGDKISRNCTKLILCEQSCKDGLRGDLRSSYPQVMEGDTPAEKEYVEAYAAGENQACYGLQTETTSVGQSYNHHPYSPGNCEVDCLQKYPSCEDEMNSSLLLVAYRVSSRAFHELGMWFFDAWWLVNDRVEYGVKLKQKAEHVVKEEFGKLYQRMIKMGDEFRNLENRTRRDVTGHSANDDEKTKIRWNNFLISYNLTDPSLVDSLYDTISYTQFVSYNSILRVTLETYDFGVDQEFSEACGFGNFSVLYILTTVILMGRFMN